MDNYEMISYIDEESPTSITSTATVDGERVCLCKIVHNGYVWTIVSWYTEKSHMHKGYGFATMKHIVNKLCAKYGTPNKIEHVWNGANKYVMEWMERHFKPVCMLPIAIQKYSDKDEWESHIYVLEKDRFLDYFGISVAE